MTQSWEMLEEEIKSLLFYVDLLEVNHIAVYNVLEMVLWNTHIKM